MLRDEKFKLKDNVNGIVRETKESVEAKNYWIEGSSEGMMGASSGWP